jgi:hypothetical protein
MLSVSVLTGKELPVEAGVKFQLVSATDGTVLASGQTDAGGIVSFDVDAASVGEVGIRLEPEAVGAT